MPPDHQLGEFLELNVHTFLLVVTRIAGILSFGPLFSGPTLPVRVRALFAIVMAAMIFSVVPTASVQPGTMIDLVLQVVGELLVGLILGSFLQIIFQALQLAGQSASTQFGLSLASILNPQFDEQTSSTAIIYATVASIVFLTTGGHREMFAALLETFGVLPLGGLFFDTSIQELALELFHRSMVFAFRVAAPATVALLLTEIGMGFVGRSVPQLNVLSLGFAVRIIVGMVVTMAALGAAGELFSEEIRHAMVVSYQALSNLVP